VLGLHVVCMYIGVHVHVMCRTARQRPSSCLCAHIELVLTGVSPRCSLAGVARHCGGVAQHCGTALSGRQHCCVTACEYERGPTSRALHVPASGSMDGHLCYHIKPIRSCNTVLWGCVAPQHEWGDTLHLTRCDLMTRPSSKYRLPC
jgi:hypothetical protein